MRETEYTGFNDTAGLIPEKIKEFLDVLKRKLFPEDPVIAQGISEDPLTEMQKLCKIMQNNRDSYYALLFSRRLWVLSKQLPNYLKKTRSASKA